MTSLNLITIEKIYLQCFIIICIFNNKIKLFMKLTIVNLYCVKFLFKHNFIHNECELMIVVLVYCE